MSKPMTDERLAEITRFVEGIFRLGAAPADMREWQRGVLVSSYLEHMPDLLAEVERQRAMIAEQQEKIAAMRPVVEAVAEGDVYYLEQPEGWNCLYCAGYPVGERTYDEVVAAKQFKHDDDCPVTLARSVER